MTHKRSSTTAPDAGHTARLRQVTRDLITAALRMAAYGEGTATSGAGQRDTMMNLVADVKEKSDAARAALTSWSDG